MNNRIHGDLRRENGNRQCVRYSGDQEQNSKGRELELSRFETMLPVVSKRQFMTSTGTKSRSLLRRAQTEGQVIGTETVTKACDLEMSTFETVNTRSDEKECRITHNRCMAIKNC